MATVLTYRADSSSPWSPSTNNPSDVISIVSGESEPRCSNHRNSFGQIDNMIEIQSEKALLYESKGSCYNSYTGMSVPDQRVEKCTVQSASCYDKYQKICPIPQDSPHLMGTGTFEASYIYGDPSNYLEESVIDNTSYRPPSKSTLLDYNIFAGLTRDIPLTADKIQINASFNSLTCAESDKDENGICWVKNVDPSQLPVCAKISYNPTNGGNMNSAPAGYPQLVAKWSFLNISERYGFKDPYQVITAPKQVRIPSAAKQEEALSIAAAGDRCDFSTGSVLPADDLGPTLKAELANQATSFSNDAPTDHTIFTYPVSYNWVGGASKSLTAEQYTPWNSERTDGITSAAPDCSIFDDESSIAKESLFAITPGIFKIGSGVMSRSFQSSALGSKDSSLNNAYPWFITGGKWISIGIEEDYMTSQNSLTDVRCRIYADGAEQPDYCTQNIPMTHEVVNGYQLVIHAESGQNGGNAGSAIILTTEKPANLVIDSAAGTPGKAGSSLLDKSSSEKALICYKDSVDPLNPWIRIFKFQKSRVQVGEGHDGNAGRDGTNNVFMGYGVMPEAIKWLGDQISTKAKTGH